MHYEKYDDVYASSDKLEFRFISHGPKGQIKKVIQFSQTKQAGIYNLAFGNLDENGTIDDEIKSDNKDRNKILATVGATVYEFTAKHPDSMVFFCGSTPERTRLYRMALTMNLEAFKKDFHIYGVLKVKNVFKMVDFKKGISYFGFIVKRNKS